MHHQEYILRAYLHYCTSDLQNIEDFDALHKLIEFYNDDKIQAKLDLYGSQGTDLTDTKCGTTFYKEWIENKHREAEERKPKTKINPDVVRKRKAQMDKELDRIMGARKLRPVTEVKSNG